MNKRTEQIQMFKQYLERRSPGRPGLVRSDAQGWPPGRGGCDSQIG